MSILATSLNNATLISHEAFLHELYENMWIDGIFDIKTPFMMDEQAKAVVRLKNSGELSHRKRKRNKKFEIACLTEIEQKMISLLKNWQKDHFEPIPVDDNVILDNNKTLREKISKIMFEASKSVLEMTRGGEGDNNYVISGSNDDLIKCAQVTINQKHYFIPPKSEYHVSDITRIKGPYHSLL